MIFFTHTKKKGFALAEMIVYVTILTLLVGVLVGSLRAVVITYRHTKISRAIETSSLNTLERITREIKNGESITLAQSVFGTATSSLTLVGKDTTEGDKTTYIYVENGVLKIREDGINKGQLTASSTEVTNFTLSLIDQTVSDAVRIQLTLEAGDGEYAKEETFYSTAILRGSY